MSGYIGWRAGTTTLCHSLLYPPVRDNEFGYRTRANCPMLSRIGLLHMYLVYLVGVNNHLWKVEMDFCLIGWRRRKPVLMGRNVSCTCIWWHRSKQVSHWSAYWNVHLSLVVWPRRCWTKASTMQFNRMEISRISTFATVGEDLL